MASIARASSASVERVESASPVRASAHREEVAPPQGRGPFLQDLGWLHEAVDKGDLAALNGLEELHLAPGNREYFERERVRLAHRQCRAATEVLQHAVQRRDLGRLRTAIAAARRRGVHAGDVEHAEALMEELEAADKDEVFRDRRAEAFAAIQADDPDAFQESVRGQAWESWLDEQGRNLTEAATDAGSRRVLELLTKGDGADKLPAFRLVCKDDAAELEAQLRGVSPFVWRQWKNRGGKTLLQLAEERSKQQVYTWLTVALGRGQVLEPEKVEEGDCVWVFTSESLQPRQAKVLARPEDRRAPVEVAFWDEVTTTHSVDPTHLRRMLT